MSGAARTPPNPLAGIALLVTAVARFSVLDTTAKIIYLSVPMFMALWFRYALQATITTVAILPSRGWSTRGMRRDRRMAGGARKSGPHSSH